MTWTERLRGWLGPPKGSVYPEHLRQAELIIELTETEDSEWRGRLQFPGGIDMNRLAIVLTTTPSMSLRLREFDDAELKLMSCHPLGSNILRENGKAVDIPLTTLGPVYVSAPCRIDCESGINLTVRYDKGFTLEINKWE
jgi:hypothetical protein